MKTLNRKQVAFVNLIINGEPSSLAYKIAFQPKTDNPDSLRAMASRERRKDEVEAAIIDGLQEIKDDAVQGAIWSRRASIIARMNDLELIDQEIQRRQDGLEMEIQGIREGFYGQHEKKEMIGRAMQRNLLGRELFAAKQMIYASLDAFDGETVKQADLTASFVDSTDFDENPDEYAANGEGISVMHDETD
mgnify:CR=1 FL=1